MKKKPNGYWTYERCKDAALECNNNRELRKNYKTVYKLIYKNDWKELMSHFKKFRKDNGYWTYENCKDVALKYDNKTKFIKSHCSTYNSIIKNNWLDLLSHMVKYHKKFDCYSYDDCKELISKCKNKTEFIKYHYPYYNTILKNNWSELLLYFIENDNHLTYKKCRELAFLCESKNEFIKKYGSAYRKISKNKWNDLISHLKSNIKPRGYWIYDKCKDVALKCKTKKELYEKYGSASIIIYKNNWNELIEHCEEQQKPKGYWTYEKCKEISLKCNSREELKKNYNGVYRTIYKNHWFELLDHMKNYKKSNGYWTYEKCKEIVNICKDKKEFRVKYATVYSTILKKRWIDLLKILNSNKKPNGYWSYEKCKEVALTCNIKSEFQKKYPTAYRIVLKNKWCELTKHMEIIGNRVKRLIYVYEFGDNCCYIGLTYNKNRRHNDHFKDKNSSVNKHYIKTGIKPKLYIKTDYIPIEEAILLEEAILNEYKNNNWIILNQIKTGGIGGSDIKWNKETCEKESKKYDKISDFMRKSKGAYSTTMKYGWIDEFFPIRRKSKDGYWNNKELCREEAKKYKNRSEFCYGSWAAYNYSNINKWLDEFYPSKSF